MQSVGHDSILIIASVLVAIMAGFAGLRMASGLSQLEPADRRPPIAKAAIALGGGIWSMHFIAMLAMVLDVQITYAALPTLGSVLVAILMVGIGLIVLHFGERTQMRILIAGTLAGLGIVCMHYLGMSAISGNIVVSYRIEGVALSTLIAIVSSIFAFQLAYHRRTLPTKAFGAVAFGLATTLMHYTAMVFTSFDPGESGNISVDPLLSSGLLAMIVALASFVISGLFLLMAIPVGTPQHKANMTGAIPAGNTNAAAMTPPAAENMPGNAASANGAVLSKIHADGIGSPARKALTAGRIPYERDKTIRFFSAEQIAAVRAEGHYSQVINGTGEYFCPWPISKIEETVGSDGFIRTHRSYLVNLDHVSGFRREGDKAYCFVTEAEDLRIPVSRARISEVQEALGLG